MRRMFSSSSMIRILLGICTVPYFRFRPHHYGQCEGEGRPAPDFRADADLPAVRLDERLRDGEPEPGPARRSPRHLHELVEDARPVFGRDAASRVADGHGDLIATPLGTDPDFAAPSVADGVDD